MKNKELIKMLEQIKLNNEDVLSQLKFSENSQIAKLIEKKQTENSLLEDIITAINGNGLYLKIRTNNK